MRRMLFLILWAISGCDSLAPIVVSDASAPADSRPRHDWAVREVNDGSVADGTVDVELEETPVLAPGVLDVRFGHEGVVSMATTITRTRPTVVDAALTSDRGVSIVLSEDAYAERVVRLLYVDSHGAPVEPRVLRVQGLAAASRDTAMGSLAATFSASTQRFVAVAHVREGARTHAWLTTFAEASLVALADVASDWRVAATDDTHVWLRSGPRLFAYGVDTLALDSRWGVGGSLETPALCREVVGRDHMLYVTCTTRTDVLSISRFDSHGHRDDSFGVDGVVEHRFAFLRTPPELEYVVAADDGLLFALGDLSPGETFRQSAIVKISYEGAHVPFGARGTNALALTDALGTSETLDMDMLDDGRVVLVVCRSSNPGLNEVLVVDAEGRPDTRYGERGAIGRRGNVQRVLIDSIGNAAILVSSEDGAVSVARYGL